ncbi:Major facilitator superfamily protein [Streptomyces venezuelae]|uniref:MFS transporter n=1 Tax=Streptomyces gardneri TaxID=66892 RepID=UPI0006BDC9A3|nr:MFS transporter [Streptomyces gardneri]ALO08391.1 Major facilitator superfamily protein [Streptomyces venezuelae]QPK45606.1 MFS transporter [Streptomyces gardneri]WRK36951.1 MFS transporter [Streptomyces venezuelae]CUM41256.1 major facilitator superfamily MFS_1 [Streptomyces venezuelae]
MALVERVPELLRERTFRRYWTGQTVSLVGDQISLIAIPLAAVLILGADAAEMGWLKTAELLPALLLNLPLGAWADRQARRRHAMIAADLGRAALMLTLPVAYALDALTLGQLYAVAFGIGALTVLFEVCNTTLLVALVPTDRYIQANALVNGSRSMSWLAGPGIGGVLVQVLTAPFALVADALTYVVSAGYLARIKAVEPPPAPVAKGHFTEGLRWVVRDPSMRALFAASGTIQLFNYMFHTLFVLYATAELGIGAGLLGLILGAGAVGGLIGAACSGAVVRRIGVGASLVLGFLGFTLPLLLIPLADGPLPLVVAVMFAAEFLSCVGVMIVDIAAGSFQMAVIPDAVRARVMGAYRTLNHGFRPLGALAGGLLGTAIGLRPTLWIATGGAVLAVLWLLPSPLPRMRELPTREEESTPVGAS